MKSEWKLWDFLFDLVIFIVASDFHISVADEKASLAQDAPVTDMPNVLICGPEVKMYAELTASPCLLLNCLFFFN